MIYSYWPLALGLSMGDLNRDDPAYHNHLDKQFAFLLQMAKDMGCPDHPDLKQGYDLSTRTVEPIRANWSPANASCLAWMLYAGYQWTGEPQYMDCAASALRWQRQRPGRYEIAHVTGPLTAARMNAEQGTNIGLSRLLNNCFGESNEAGGRDQPWGITHGTKLGGKTCDGLDGALWQRRGTGEFYAFAMGSYQSPAWLLPLVRYDQRYARCIGRYALDAANSCRSFLRIDLDADHEDHLGWRKNHPGDQGFFFSYENVRSEPHHADAGHAFGPYATGDPLAVFSKKYVGASGLQYWIVKANFARASPNISMYMANHISFLGAVYHATSVPGIVAWDLVKTDYFHGPCFPTFLLYNPYPHEVTARFDIGPTECDLYDAVTGLILRRQVADEQPITLAQGQAVVLALMRCGATLRRDGTKLLVGNIVVNNRANAAVSQEDRPQ